ncbi:hypothetical protein GGI25_001647 [Coemansia spiralis]|uniref:Non-structural maintenance of chromosomes element 1 homolog n=2 Tax=Coemansia TaxID=4863 RepID=A0A9W8G5Q4_9FUNG|nr:hypothetical protein BX070DRAFT_255211 [Coemansia spiralis]KAJ2623922.1 hypothetical protein GGI26_001937 [Coemansia sp. RSA 1358]KAJ2679291.1 hypothetical protein GGI25_001647 [Coemansia spiralis]
MSDSAEVGATERKMLIQWCMSSQLFTDTSLRQTIERLYPADSMEDIQAEVDQINSMLSLFSLELRGCMNQTNGERQWAVVNTNADPISIGITPYSAAELNSLKVLIETIFAGADGNYAIDLHAALRTIANLGPSGFTRGNAQEFLSRLCQDGWLDKETFAGYVVLGGRALIELQPYLNGGYGDFVRICSLCKEMATCGVVCNQCQVPVHPYCASQIEQSVGALSCPKCHQRMTGSLRFGPGEIGVPHSLAGTPQADRSGLSLNEGSISPSPLPSPSPPTMPLSPEQREVARELFGIK